MSKIKKNDIWERMMALQDNMMQKLDAIGTPVDEGHDFPWPNHVWTSPLFRRAHLDAVDARSTKKLYMLHITVMPHVHDSSPIFGFDIICGEKKITGCFHDFSSAGYPDHAMMHWFQDHVKQYEWNKERELPDWAQRIFSPGMVAAGNVQDEDEVQQIINMVTTTFDFYLSHVGRTRGRADPRTVLGAQNNYCANQRQNPHTPKVMQSLGFDEETVDRFIRGCLFPDLV